MNQKNQNQLGSEDNQDKSLSDSQQSQSNTGTKTPSDQQKQHGHQNLGQPGARPSDMGGKSNKSQQH